MDNNFSHRANLILKEPAHLALDSTNTRHSTQIDWSYSRSEAPSIGGGFKILTLRYYPIKPIVVDLDLLILEVFSSLSETRQVRQIFNISFKEIENFLRDANNIPSIPEVLTEPALRALETIKNDFLTFYLLNEFSSSAYAIDAEMTWDRLSLVERTKLINELLRFCDQFLGNVFPQKLVYVSQAEVVLLRPDSLDLGLEQVLVHFLSALGISATLKLVAG